MHKTCQGSQMKTGMAKFAAEGSTQGLLRLVFVLASDQTSNADKYQLLCSTTTNPPSTSSDPQNRRPCMEPSPHQLDEPQNWASKVLPCPFLRGKKSKCVQFDIPQIQCLLKGRKNVNVRPCQCEMATLTHQSSEQDCRRKNAHTIRHLTISLPYKSHRGRNLSPSGRANHVGQCYSF